MGTMSVPSRTLSSIFKGLKMRIFGFHLIERDCSQQSLGCHSVSFVMYISGAKFEGQCFNIS